MDSVRTPIPTSLLLVAVLGVAFWTGNTHANLWGGSYIMLGAGFHPLSLMYFVSGSAMISMLKVPKP